VRGWLGLYRLSWRLGLTRPSRQSIIRLVIPMDPSRYLELPYTIDALKARPGERVLDLASPKLAAVALARQGAEVTSVDLFEEEVRTWSDLAGDVPGLRFGVADGRSLPYEDESFDHAYSVSVLDHVPGDGDGEALAELARVVRPGGRVIVTLPYSERYEEDWRDQPVYGDQEAGPDGRYFFERHYDDARLDRLVAAAPALRPVDRSVVRMLPNWNRLYLRSFPWLIALGPFYGVLGRERPGPPGDVVRLSFERGPARGAGS
jgi:SAM-dependent methyltransferase